MATMNSRNSTGPSPERIAQLRRRVMEHRQLNPNYQNALILSAAIGGLASLIRGYYGWSYEEAGILLNLAFWGGYGLAVFILGPIVLLAWLKDWRRARDMSELEKANAVPDGFES